MATDLKVERSGTKWLVAHQKLDGSTEYGVMLRSGRMGLGVRRGEATEFESREAAERVIRGYRAEEAGSERDPESRDPNVLVQRELDARRARLGEQDPDRLVQHELRERELRLRRAGR